MPSRRSCPSNKKEDHKASKILQKLESADFTSCRSDSLYGFLSKDVCKLGITEDLTLVALVLQVI